uniref:Uncharacterized protein n=1 Tax=Caulobacter sp. (strain K31) TaxID=366602 RepID=B0T649_CAUSK
MAMKLHLSAAWVWLKPIVTKKGTWALVLTFAASSFGVFKLEQVDGLSNIVSGAITLLSILLGG